MMFKQECAGCKRVYWTHDLSSSKCYDCRTKKEQNEEEDSKWRPRSRSAVVDEGIPGAEERE